MVPPSSLPHASGSAQLHVVRIENVDVDVVRQVRVVSRHYGGIGTHYFKGRSRYCRPDACPSDRHKTEWYFRAYFSAEWFCNVRKLWIPCVWEMTEQGELDVRDVFARGQVWEWTRKTVSPKRRPPQSGRLLGSYPEAALPEEWDYRGVVLRAYHEQRMEFNVRNPMPPRVQLPASSPATGFVCVDPPVDPDALQPKREKLPSITELCAAHNGNGKAVKS